MQASPSTGEPSKDGLLIKCLELGVVIGMAMACCSVTIISHLQHPLVPRCSATMLFGPEWPNGLLTNGTINMNVNSIVLLLIESFTYYYLKYFSLISNLIVTLYLYGNVCLN